MIESKVRQLIHKLAKLTNENKMDWYVTNRDTEYAYSFSHGRVTIDRWLGQDDGSAFVEFVIYNNNGDQVERLMLCDDDNDEDFTLLNNFYNIVYKKYIKSEETLDGILSDLEVIDSDAEIPF